MHSRRSNLWTLTDSCKEKCWERVRQESRNIWETSAYRNYSKGRLNTQVTRRLILDINQSLFSHLVKPLELQGAKSFSHFQWAEEKKKEVIIKYVGFDVWSKTENPIYYDLKQ